MIIHEEIDTGVKRTMYSRSTSTLIAAAVALLVVACGSDGLSGAASEQGDLAPPVDSDKAGTSTIIDNGGIYTIEDFEAAGYKKVTQFDLETLPGATDAWYGFANQKDFEIRVYPSHQVALDERVEPPEVAIGKGAVPWQKAPPVRLFSYAVVGNVVMLCELEVASCEALVAQLE